MSENSTPNILSDGQRAQIRLEVDFLNGIALNAQSVGTFGFLAALIFNDQLPKDRMIIAAFFQSRVLLVVLLCTLLPQESLWIFTENELDFVFRPVFSYNNSHRRSEIYSPL